MHEITFSASGKSLMLSGGHPAYLESVDGFVADHNMLGKAVSSVSPGSVLFDVGANVGLTAISMAVLRPDCQIFAFEAVPSNAKFLRSNIDANGIKNIEVVEAAVSDRPGIVRMTDNGPWSVASTSDAALDCRAVTLDQYADYSPSFLKIDVEGFEPNVLAGAAEILRGANPSILMEFNSYTLLLHHYDPLTFAHAIWNHYEIIKFYNDKEAQELPKNADMMFFTNLIPHGCVSNLLLRSKGKLPSLSAMTESPATQSLRAATTPMSRTGRLSSVIRWPGWRA